MSTAIRPDIWLPIRQTLRLWPANNHAPNRYTTHAPPHPDTVHFVAPSAVAMLPKPLNDTLTKPLRIVRVVESGQTRSTVGRMVISGRMADVCAELDRLVACETA